MKRLSLFFFAVIMTIMSGCDPCRSTVCLNDGRCANGECVCPEGFAGADCSQQVTPDKILINSIEVTRFPETDNGAGWDLTSGPDIYPVLSKDGIDLYREPLNNVRNADPSIGHQFGLIPSVDLNDPTEQYSLSLYDYDDFDPDDYMGGVVFTPYSNTNGFPFVIELDNGGSVAFRIQLTYVW